MDRISFDRLTRRISISHPRLATQNVTGLPQLQLTDDEIASLIWAASEQGPKQPFGHALPSAAAKLRGLAAIRKNQVASDLDWTLVAQTRGRKDYTLHHPRIARLVEAIIRRPRCRVRYQPPNSVSMALLDGISYFPHGKSEMLRRKSEMLRGIWHFLRGKRKMPHGFCGFRTENAKCCAEFGIFCAEKRKNCTDFAIFCVENAKCRTDFAVSARKKRNPARNLRFSARKMRNAVRNLGFATRKMRNAQRNSAFSARKKRNPARNSAFSAPKKRNPAKNFGFSAQKGRNSDQAFQS